MHHGLVSADPSSSATSPLVESPGVSRYGKRPPGVPLEWSDMLPVSPVVLPSTLTGHANGELPDDVLVDVGGGQLLERNAAASWRDMAQAASRDGVLLTIDNAYRSLARQEEFFRARYVTYDTGSGESHMWNGQRWWRLPNAITAAVPGQSNHGYGLAVDLLKTDAQVAWMTEHAAEWGWSAELQSEPWHWHRFAGDYISSQPVEEPDVQWRILAPAGSAAKFIAPMSPLPDGTLAALYCVWLPTGDRVQAYASRGVTELALGVDDLKNVPLIGELPHGDVIAWTAANFLS